MLKEERSIYYRMLIEGQLMERPSKKTEILKVCMYMQGKAPSRCLTLSLFFF
jgi:hypothetical protein